MGNPRSQGDRAKAYRLRKERAKGTITPVNALWLAEFEENKAEHDKRRAGATDVGASRSGRRLRVELDEAAESAGTGSAAVAAASAALAAKEEGRRLDSLTVESVGALKEACAVYRDMCLSMRERMESLEQVQVDLLTSVRGHYLARTEAETALLQQANDDPSNALLAALAGKVLGVNLPGFAGSNGGPPDKGYRGG